MTTVYVSIGNSDDKLPQADWSAFVQQFMIAVRHRASRIYGEWYSLPNTIYQNACIAAEVNDPDVPLLRSELARLREAHHQDSVASAVAETEFL